MSDILSQEQIDALLSSDGLSGGGGGSDFGFGNTSEAVSTVDKYGAISKILELFCNQAGMVLSTVINKKTDLTPEQLQKTDFAEIQNRINNAVLSLKLSFKSGLDGDFYLLIKKTDVAILSDLMMMGDGNAEYSEDHKDAIGELFNQVMGAFATALGGEFGTSVSAANIEVTEFDLDNPPFSGDSLDMSMVSLAIDAMSDSSITFLITEILADQIVTKSPQPQQNSGSNGGIGLSMSELDDLSRVTSFDTGSQGFRETSLTGEPMKGSRDNIEMLLDVELDVNIELGRSLLSIKRILELAPGSIVELDRMAGEPVDLLVNNKVVAKGEVVVIDENFGIRIVSLVSAEERIKSLR
jgi:flagellar motor switch protein FliN/FliY